MEHFKTNVWYEKHRPKCLDDIVLPEDMKTRLRQCLKDGAFNLPHLGLFSYNPGTGKSSLARVILEETKAEHIWINASMDKGIDVLRTKIHRFAAQAGFKDSVKIVVMDEFDRFSKDGQDAFRGFIDDFGDNVRFIFTGNYRENIITPLLDRMEVYDFNQFKKEDMIKPIYLRLCKILEEENVTYDPKDVATIIKNRYPGIRSMVKDLGRYSKDNRLDLSNGFDDDLTLLTSLIQEKKYEEVLKVVYGIGSTDHLFTYFANNISDLLNKPSDKINAYIILGKYQSMHEHVRDKHLNLAACCCELMKL